jgi:hypothetical protein
LMKAHISSLKLSMANGYKLNSIDIFIKIP